MVWRSSSSWCWFEYFVRDGESESWLEVAVSRVGSRSEAGLWSCWLWFALAGFEGSYSWLWWNFRTVFFVGLFLVSPAVRKSRVDVMLMIDVEQLYVLECCQRSY
ncbi:hypothetical protein Droror1_Dr00016643 [Drosera rotundifolia]